MYPDILNLLAQEEGITGAAEQERGYSFGTAIVSDEVSRRRGP
jgi:hypothetical protein